MFWTRGLKGLSKLAAAGLAVLLAGSLASAQETKTVPAGTPVTITVAPAAAAAPGVSIALNGRHAHATPERVGFTHTGGGNIKVDQPSPDTVIITMTGVAVAGGHPCKCSSASMVFDIEQCFEIVFDDPKIKRAKLSLEANAIGLLRSEKKGSAALSSACTSVTAEGNNIIGITFPPHTVGGGENLSINCHEGPVVVPVGAGKYVLNQNLGISATHPKCLLPCKAASAEFAPDPALDPLWISYWEPFHGAAKGDFGFVVTVKVMPE